MLRLSEKIKDNRVFRNLTEPPEFSGADPSIISDGERLILAQSTENDLGISLRTFTHLDDIKRGEEHIVYRAIPGHRRGSNTWSPALRKYPQYPDNWFIHFAEDDGDNKNHRMYTLRSKSTDPLGEYEDMGQMADWKHDFFAIDAAVFTDNGQFYVAYSGWETANDSFPQRQNIYIAPMYNPWTIAGERSKISTPTYNWEIGKLRKPEFGGDVLVFVNEGPEIPSPEPINPEAITFAAGASWGVYPLGKIERVGLDVLNPDSWEKRPEPIFPNGGHGSVVMDRGELFYVYAATTEYAGWPGRKIYKIEASKIPELSNAIHNGPRRLKDSPPEIAVAAD